MARNPNPVRIGTWNTGWARPGTGRGHRVAAALAVARCDVLCVTEGYGRIFPPDGHLIEAGADWGYVHRDGRRKVLLWSRRPWSDVDPLGSDALPGGRFVAGTTETALGPLRVVGVCIPWRDAHVRSGRKDRKAWQDHEAWLAGFEALPWRRAARRTVVLGDFNQRIPRRRQPARVYEALQRAFAGLEIATAGRLPGTSERPIDHIAHSPDLAPAGDIRTWPMQSAEARLSDHIGVRGGFVAAG